MIGTYNKRPVEVQAMLYFGEDTVVSAEAFVKQPMWKRQDDALVFEMRDNNQMLVPPGWWIVHDPLANTFFPVEPDVFADCYE